MSPPSRLSRRRLLSLPALAAPLFVPFARAADRPRFDLGVASGHPSPDSVVLWTRLLGEDLPERVDVQWELAHDQGFKRLAARGTATAEAAWAHSVHVQAAGLEPARWYHYRFSALGQRSPVGSTRTTPAPDAAAGPLRFAIASCQRWDHGHFAAWAHTAREPLDLVLFLGDYIYEYASPRHAVRRHEGGLIRTLADYRARYAQYKRDPALQAAHAAAPWLLVWDDHEVENDYAGERGRELQGEAMRALRAAAYQAWWEHQPVPPATRPVGPALRIDGRCDWGRLARFHLLDDRQYRDPQACLPAGRLAGSSTVLAADCAALRDPQRSLLGAAQERWLAEGWDAERPWNLVAQQTLMARASSRAVDPTDAGSGRYWTDGWDGYAPARQRLLAGAVERRARNPVVLGGDVHAHFVADLKLDFADDKAPVVASEFCGSSISSHGSAQSRVDEVVAHNPHLHHGRSDQRGDRKSTRLNSSHNPAPRMPSSA
jgi:alkaline phosphatase D